jgi:hypothetical protein
MGRVQHTVHHSITAQNSEFEFQTFFSFSEFGNYKKLKKLYKKEKFENQKLN